MIRPSIVLMIRQITMNWKFWFKITAAWLLRFSLNTLLIWTMYFLILALVIARNKSEIFTIHWGNSPNTNLIFCILVKIFFASSRLFSVIFNLRLSFLNFWEIVAFAESMETFFINFLTFLSIREIKKFSLPISQRMKITGKSREYDFSKKGKELWLLWYWRMFRYQIITIESCEITTVIAIK